MAGESAHINEPEVKYEEQTQFSEGENRLAHVLEELMSFDTLKIFVEPVDDSFAPNYSKIIKTPMCFVTMKNKVQDKQYLNWRSFVDDFERICNNAMKYNKKRSDIWNVAHALLKQGKAFLDEIAAKGENIIVTENTTDPSIRPPPNTAKNEQDLQLLQSPGDDRKLDISSPDAPPLPEPVPEHPPENQPKAPEKSAVNIQVDVTESEAEPIIPSAPPVERPSASDLTTDASSSFGGSVASEESDVDWDANDEFEQFQITQGMGNDFLDDDTEEPAPKRAMHAEWKSYREGIEWRCRWIEIRLRHLKAREKRYLKLLDKKKQGKPSFTHETFPQSVFGSHAFPTEEFDELYFEEKQDVKTEETAAVQQAIPAFSTAGDLPAAMDGSADNLCGVQKLASSENFEQERAGREEVQFGLPLTRQTDTCARVSCTWSGRKAEKRFLQRRQRRKEEDSTEAVAGLSKHPLFSRYGGKKRADGDLQSQGQAPSEGPRVPESLESLVGKFDQLQNRIQRLKSTLRRGSFRAPSSMRGGTLSSPPARMPQSFSGPWSPQQVPGTPRGPSNLGPGRRRNSEYDISNMVIGGGAIAAKYVQPVRHEEIEVPKWGEADEEAAGDPTGDSSSEGTADEEYESRHAVLEEKERLQFLPASLRKFSGDPGSETGPGSSEPAASGPKGSGSGTVSMLGRRRGGRGVSGGKRGGKTEGKDGESEGRSGRPGAGGGSSGEEGLPLPATVVRRKRSAGLRHPARR